MRRLDIVGKAAVKAAVHVLVSASDGICPMTKELECVAPHRLCSTRPFLPTFSTFS